MGIQRICNNVLLITLLGTPVEIDCYTMQLQDRIDSFIKDLRQW